MEINRSDALTYMIYDKEFLYIFDYLTLTIKMEAIKKRVNVRFFHEKWETLKVPKTSISYLHVIRFQMETKNSAIIMDLNLLLCY